MLQASGSLVSDVSGIRVLNQTDAEAGPGAGAGTGAGAGAGTGVEREAKRLKTTYTSTQV